jgi:hypothetical protein
MFGAIIVKSLQLHLSLIDLNNQVKHIIQKDPYTLDWNVK